MSRNISWTRRETIKEKEIVITVNKNEIKRSGKVVSRFSKIQGEWIVWNIDMDSFTFSANCPSVSLAFCLLAFGAKSLE
jgi:hypothetical protein